MPVSTASAAAHITPVVIKTFVEHRKKRNNREREGHEAPQDDILFDEAFSIVKAFIELGTKNTVESLQAFTNTRVPSLFWVAVSPVSVPLTTCNDAADILIDWFGPEELKYVVGGERWWQVRGLSGIDAEWIAEREHLDEAQDVGDGRKLTKEEQDILRMEKLESVMLYVHGGGYFWGSINTHRYQIVRYAHKLKGRTFTVNYRKAPQYPWPCPIHDVLAAYLYLIQPPPGAIHKPINPKKIVFAGDSAGGGLCITVMTILRDMGLPLPAGAALISPWVDLTHSFPSILQNTETDIIPAHGFLAKPSVLWPLEPVPGSSGRICRSETNPPPIPGESDTLKPSPERIKIEESGVDVPQGNYAVETQEEMLEKYGSAGDRPSPTVASSHVVGSGARRPFNPSVDKPDEKTNASPGDIPVDFKAIRDIWEPKPAKILMENSIETPLEMRSQIQLYATNEQLTHPLVSPISQGSLGNLPPLYILAGDSEMLRDEIIYLAHRAAYPSQYPVRESVLNEANRQRENAAKFTTPTKVHLQVFDGMCHVMTVFMFTESARYAYRSIAEFAKHVTQRSEEGLEFNPFPEVQSRSATSDKSQSRPNGETWLAHPSDDRTENEEKRESPDSERMYEHDGEDAQKETRSKRGYAESPKPKAQQGSQPGVRPVSMLRERVNIHGFARPMEPREELAILQIPPSQIGLIRQAPAMRWFHGQEEWDRRYHKTAIRVLKKRGMLSAKADRLIRHAFDQGLVHEAFPESVVERPVEKASGRAVKHKTSIGEIQADRRWGPLDLGDERPPPSAIAARRDTDEALALLRKTIYHTAPVTHKTVPRLKTSDAFRATIDPHDNPNAPPKQSVSEQQVDRSQISAFNGLRIWEKILGYLGRKSSAKASDGIKSTAAFVHRN